jgi:hypothetical protein
MANTFRPSPLEGIASMFRHDRRKRMTDAQIASARRREEIREQVGIRRLRQQGLTLREAEELYELGLWRR